MNRIKAWVPSYSSIEAETDKPDNWDDLTLKEKKEYFGEHMEVSGGICHQCSDVIQCEFELDDQTYYDEKWWDENDFQED